MQKNGSGSKSSKLLRVGNLEVYVPTVVVQAFKLNRIPGFRHYLTTENGQTTLGTIPVIGTGTAKFVNATGQKVIERQVGFTLANDGKTRIPVTMIEEQHNTRKWFSPGVVSVEQINNAIGQI